MNQAAALTRFGHLARLRAFGRHAGSDQLIQAGLDALLAGIDSPSLPELAGLLRSEEPEAPELFERVLDELGLTFRAPAEPRAAAWAFALWTAEQMVDGSLDAASGAYLIRAEIADDLGRPEELDALIHCSVALDSWEESWGEGGAVEVLEAEAVEAARALLRSRGTDGEQAPAPEPGPGT
ncbi:hypothetical protein KV205_19910 [Streptomyces sp. SKN60]|uniref:hypothetical protein n=1 Tax=Streptomyces sp. SKN60 TaxID=2855506 RepID=UPI002245933B|nr:hypothetical protein [Streptomyces sp. SKN60]MCX2182772.1 hypothetical protein [Streptomyces sp. SKN60]